MGAGVETLKSSACRDVESRFAPSGQIHSHVSLLCARVALHARDAVFLRSLGAGTVFLLLTRQYSARTDWNWGFLTGD